jgi:hypothetical protein
MDQSPAVRTVNRRSARKWLGKQDGGHGNRERQGARRNHARSNHDPDQPDFERRQTRSAPGDPPDHEPSHLATSRKASIPCQNTTTGCQMQAKRGRKCPRNR